MTGKEEVENAFGVHHIFDGYCYSMERSSFVFGNLVECSGLA